MDGLILAAIAFRDHLDGDRRCLRLGTYIKFIPYPVGQLHPAGIAVFLLRRDQAFALRLVV